MEWRNDPTSIGEGRLKLIWYLKFWRGDICCIIHHCHGKDGNDYSKITDELADLKKRLKKNKEKDLFLEKFNERLKRTLCSVL